ncbi:ABC transporter permease [Clostridium sp. AM42-4]|jgi:peptide/nickel transport system permease protein|uniref:ABC transporter permease n=2 Tax=unclassified Clostridium TaxID=2614128 RepID=UPI000E4EEA2C|nr:ABC transporter permease [Clostridium sp. AM42-4]RHS91082.1 ABC transporter permease [Clostridium sp. AM42-4]HBM47656.1 glutathione ABC transporter permease GsiC [Lachnoclostridium sp.]
MLSYTGKRLLQTIFVLLGISLITFVLLQVVPGDPVALMLEKRADPETIAKVRKELGLDLPYYVQYLNFIKGAIHLDFGTSYFTKEVVTDALIRCFKVTVKLACMSFIFASVIGIPCGIFAAVKRGKGIDTVVMVLSIIGVSAPAFWVAIILQILFGLKLNILPISGFDTPASYILPSLALGARYAGNIARITRTSMLEVLGQDYIRTAKAKGAMRWAVILKHALKNAMIPIVTLVGTDFGYMLTGSMLIEKVFSIPGIGKLAVDAMSNRDLPLLEGTVMYIAFVFVVVNLIVDVSYAFLDPRIRYGKGAA